MSIYQNYTRELKNETSYTATWLPSNEMNLGDVGIMKDYQFYRRTNLHDLGISFEINESNSVADISHNSSGKVSIKFNTDASLVSKNEVGIEINFSDSNGIVFNATGCKVQEIKNQEKLGAQILEARKEKKWNEEFVVITEAVFADNLSVFISSGSGAKVNLKAKIKDGSQLNFANANSSLSLEDENNIATKIIASGKITPLFRSIGIKKRFFRPEVVRDMNHTEEDQEFVTELDYEDFI